MKEGCCGQKEQYGKTGPVCTEKERTLADCGRMNGIIRMLLVYRKSDSYWFLH